MKSEHTFQYWNSRRLTAEEVWEMGELFSTKSTIDSPFIPRFGEGARIFGEIPGKGGKWLIDFCSGIGVNCLGYRDYVPVPLTNLIMLPGNEWHNESEVLLKKKLCEITPGAYPKKVFLCNSGAEALESAIKECMAWRYRELKNASHKKVKMRVLQKRVFAAFKGAFHGRTLGALSLNCSKKWHTEAFFEDGGDLSAGFAIKHRAFPVRHLPFPEQGDTESISMFNEMLDIYPWNDTIAFFIELIQGEGGIKVIDKESLSRLAKSCQENNVILVADEVQTGMMRTGKMFACNHFNLEPDIICLSKALSGGRAAIGAVIAKAEFDFERDGQHSNTFGGSPYPSEVALATINELEQLDRPELEERVRILSEFAPEGLGLMRRFKFANPEERNKVCDLALRRDDLGVMVIPAGEISMRLMHPINIPMEDQKLGIEILKSCM